MHKVIFGVLALLATANASLHIKGLAPVSLGTYYPASFANRRVKLPICIYSDTVEQVRSSYYLQVTGTNATNGQFNLRLLGGSDLIPYQLYWHGTNGVSYQIKPSQHAIVVNRANCIDTDVAAWDYLELRVNYSIFMHNAPRAGRYNDYLSVMVEPV